MNIKKRAHGSLVFKSVSEGRTMDTVYGESMPVASNISAAGEEKIRRVELELVVKQ